MKKILTALMCLMLVGALAFSVSAASGSVSLAPSAATLHRGDTFTVVANLSNSASINLGTVVLSYDENVFEMTGGTCHVSGANPAQVIPAQKVGTFFLGTASVVSGKIFTFNFKVKSNAAFGTYSITTRAAIGTSSGENINATGTTVTIACSHSYGAWVQSGSGHQQACSVCGDIKTASHTWNSGTVTKQPTCKEEGVKTHTCTVCNATKTETVAKTNTHKYGSWTKVNDTTHKHTCTVCQKEETANHTWNSGTVTKQATCKEEGVKTYSCTACNATKTEAVAKTAHKYGSWTKANDTTHKHTCTVCQKEETANHAWNSGTVTKKATCKEEGVKTYTCTGCGAAKTEGIAKLTTHTYDHDCDADCNVCGAERAVIHKYKTSWSKNKTEHWHECSVCKDKKDAAAHTPGAEATETKAQTCIECGYVIKAALGHKHSYADAWTTDEAGHWYACSGCEEKGSYAEHAFENACDPDCAVCGYTRQTSHTYAEAWESDEANHWHVCSGCDEKADEAAHIPGQEATATTAQTCTVCGYEIAPALGGEETQPTTQAPTEPTQIPAEDKPRDSTFPWWIILVAVIAIGGIAVLLVQKKKNS